MPTSQDDSHFSLLESKKKIKLKPLVSLIIEEHENDNTKQLFDDILNVFVGANVASNFLLLADEKSRRFVQDFQQLLEYFFYFEYF